MRAIGIAGSTLAAALVGASLLVAGAQTPQGLTLPEGALSDPGLSFRAQVDEPPTREQFEQGRRIADGEGGGIACASCHGPAGLGEPEAGYPRLARQPGWYMRKQLDDYASGPRPNEVMTPIAKELSASDRAAVSAYYALLPSDGDTEAPEPAEARQLRRGAVLNAVGSAERGIPGCTNCHGADAEGIAPSVPALAGQHAGYIAAQLGQWRQGVRANDPMNVMKAIADKMTDEDIEAVSAYLARLRPPGTPGARLQPSRQ